MRVTGNRAIVSAGWAGLGKAGVPEDLKGSVYILTSQYWLVILSHKADEQRIVHMIGCLPRVACLLYVTMEVSIIKESSPHILSLRCWYNCYRPSEWFTHHYCSILRGSKVCPYKVIPLTGADSGEIPSTEQEQVLPPYHPRG